MRAFPHAIHIKVLLSSRQSHMLPVPAMMQPKLQALSMQETASLFCHQSDMPLVHLHLFFYKSLSLKGLTGDDWPIEA